MFCSVLMKLCLKATVALTVITCIICLKIIYIGYTKTNKSPKDLESQCLWDFRQQDYQTIYLFDDTLNAQIHTSHFFETSYDSFRSNDSFRRNTFVYIAKMDN